MKVKTLKKQIICLVPLELRCIRGTSFGKTKGNISPVENTVSVVWKLVQASCSSTGR